MTSCIGEDSTNIRQGVEHNHVANTIVGSDESHRIGTLSQMFHVMAQKIKDAKEDDQVDNVTDSATPTKKVRYMLQLHRCSHVYFVLTHLKFIVSKVKPNSILDELQLAKQFKVFKFTSIGPDVKYSEIVASIGVEKVTPELISTGMKLIMDTLLFYGFRVGFGTSDAAGCNWVAFNSMSELTLCKILPVNHVSKYPHINFDPQIVHQDPIVEETLKSSMLPNPTQIPMLTIKSKCKCRLLIKSESSNIVL